MSDENPVPKTDLDEKLRQSELHLKELEIGLKKQELATKRSFSFSPITTTAIATLLGLVGTVVGSITQGRLNAGLEEKKFQLNLQLERQRFESALIAKLLQTGNTASAAENIAFLVDAGIIREYDAQKVLDASQKHKPVLPPSAPTAQEAYGPPIGGFVLSKALPPDVKAALRDPYARYEHYLRTLGLKFSRGGVRINTNGVGPGSAFYDPRTRTISVDKSILSDTDVLFRQYTWYALDVASGFELKWAPSTALALASGLADYYPGSYKNNPVLYAKAAKLLRVPSGFHYARNLENRLKFDMNKLPSQSKTLDVNDAGEVWAGAFWEIKKAQGQKRTDRLLFMAWSDLEKTNFSTDFRLSFVTRLLDEARRIDGTDTAQQIRAIFERRGLHL